jgi:phosphoribosylanthranilate isomerase
MPDYVGFVFAKSRRQVSIEQAEQLRNKLNKGIIPVGVFVDEQVDKVAFLLEKGIIEMAQLHGSEDEEYISKLKELTGKSIIKAVSIKTKEDIRKEQESLADFLLLDQGNGGTGTTFDWNLIEKSTRPFFLAGGLNLGNIEEALKKINPYAVDLSSGVESNGIKDEVKIIEIIRRIRNV